MEFLQAFPIAIIDEDYEGKRAAGRGMRQLAAAIEKEGFRVVAGLSYRYIEEPLLRLKTRFASDTGPAERQRRRTEWSAWTEVPVAEGHRS